MVIFCYNILDTCSISYRSVHIGIGMEFLVEGYNAGNYHDVDKGTCSLSYQFCI